MKLPGALSKLDEEQFEYMFSLLGMGKSDSEITDAIQLDKGWLTDVKRPTLFKAVQRWRKAAGQEAVVLRAAHAITDANGNLRRQLDVVEEMTELFQKQKKRVEKMAEKEDISPMLLQSVSDEMKTLFTMAKEIGNMQLAVGLKRRVRQGELAADYADFEEVEDASGDPFSDEDRALLLIEQYDPDEEDLEDADAD